MDISSYEQLLIDRYEFEEELYNTLISNNIQFLIQDIQDILDDEDNPFWNPVIVCLSDSQIESLETVIVETRECLICNENNDIFKKVNCCNNKICLDCTINWFKKSVFCPFCKRDQREGI